MTLLDMMQQPYPISAGFKIDGTSREAAASIDAAGTRAKVLAALATHGPLTADQIATALTIDKLSIRPRLSELFDMGAVLKTDLRRPNASGKSAIVWKIKGRLTDLRINAPPGAGVEWCRMARDSASGWNVTDTEIERYCSYISDDGAVSAYTGVARERIAEIRARMPAQNPRRFLEIRSEPAGVDGNGQALVARNHAEAGSQRLLNMLERLFERFEHQHNLNRGEGKIVQLYGWGTLNRLRGPFIGKASEAA